ncbi:hypothetical protein PDIG_30410 [Penicillium digitatum PHI26]|uniref:Uncharacterized protein n=2 Tax=Penicillium digitatum TaxID=36651 RepID=K9G064_PEND2|nr:hypothetical protein PDIP_64790 [Penicillium digitatum Pd1]EKV09397.1 hypothetical protein PDIP_64790 [Penicillium digitatum Pd1]EKV14764.1 hypothetical protein PDIG_30410 [Penicillium digitatum PHI26]
MYEPIYGFYQPGLAPEPLTLENFESFDVATVSTNLPGCLWRPCLCFGHVPSTESIPPMVDISGCFSRVTILRCRSMEPVANVMSLIAGYIRVFDLWTGGEKLARSPSGRESYYHIPESGLLTWEH